jgi:hypothetical protein
MRTPAAGAVAMAVAVAFSAPALAAEAMSKAQYAVARKSIESDFRTARVGCEPMLANVKDICLADVTGREGVALAELEALYVPGTSSLQGVRIAKARAIHALALEKCDDKAPSARQACVKDADAANVAARAAEGPVRVDAKRL